MERASLCHDERMDEYWTPLRDEARRYWQRVLERREAEERGRQAWIAKVKRRYGLRCIGDEEEDVAVPARQDYVAAPEADVPYRFFSLGPMLVSPDGVNFYEKPDGMTTEEFFSSLP